MESSNNLLNDPENEITVGMGKFEVKKEGFILICVGIGSCISTNISDEANKIYGMAHIMLPFIKGNFKTGNPNRYADVCIPNMIKEMERLGARKANLIARIAGGAHMFPSLISEEKSINVKNIEAVKAVLNDLGIPIVAEDLGGNNGRTIKLDTNTGVARVLIRSLGKSYDLTNDINKDEKDLNNYEN